MAFPAPDWDGIVREVDREFVKVLRQNLTAAGLFPVHQVRDLGVQTVQWKELSQIPGAKITMNLPSLSPDSGTMTAKSVDIPVLTKDTHYDYRQYLAAQASGVDVQAADELGFALAVEVNKLLLKGNTGGPGPTTGLLNTSGQLTVTGQTGWATGNNVVASLNTGIAKLMDKNHFGKFVLMMAPLDADLMGGFISSTSATVQDNLPALVSNVVFEKEVAQGDAYLIEPGARNFDAVSPFKALGQTELITYQDVITKGVDMRWVTALAPRLKHTDAVCKISFTR